MDTTTILLIAGGVILAAAIAYSVMRPRGPKEVVYLNLDCPKCKRKLRYLPRQAGHRGSCPRCNQVLRFPDKD